LRGCSRRLKDSHQLVHLCQQAFQLGSFENACVDDQLQPESRFVSLFERDPDLRDKVSVGPSPACTPVVGRYRCSRAENLPTQDAGLFRFWQRVKQVNNSQRKLFSPPPQVFRTRNCLRIIVNHRSPIANHQCRQFLSGLPRFNINWMRSLVLFWPQRLRKASRSKSSRYGSETSCGEVNSPPPERIFAN